MLGMLPQAAGAPGGTCAWAWDWRGGWVQVRFAGRSRAVLAPGCGVIYPQCSNVMTGLQLCSYGGLQLGALSLCCRGPCDGRGTVCLSVEALSLRRILLCAEAAPVPWKRLWCQLCCASSSPEHQVFGGGNCSMQGMCVCSSGS